MMSGIECTNCGCRHLPVSHTRPMPGGKIKRYRQCRYCGKKKVTVEREEKKS